MAPSSPTAGGRRRNHLPLEAFLVSVLVFLVLGALAIIPWGFKAFDPIKEVLNDFSYTDVYYTKISREARVDTSIVLINIGRADRRALADLVEAVGAAHPRAMGLDAYFLARPDAGTARLAKVLKAQPRLVVGEYLTEPAGSPASAFNLPPTQRGYLNFVGNDSLNTTVRYFRPFLETADRRYTSWSAQLLRLADPAAFAALQSRQQDRETIRYQGDLSRFIAYEGAAVTAGAVPPAALKGKIIILGFLGEPMGTRTSLEDLHFTPLNAKQLGRSLPDMYGPVIQANILSMMLHRDYITPTPRWGELLLAFGVCYLHVMLFMYLYVHYLLWYHPLTTVIQFVSGAVLVYFMIQLFVGASVGLGVVLPVLTMILAVDVLCLYEALAAWLYRKRGIRSYIIHAH